MTNKNVSQLPTNSDPQDSDWLLGASGDSPSVFQKIPVGSLIPTTQNSGSIKFSLPVNQNTALTSSGYYFTDNIAANIGIDCSGLGIGEHISWLNLSTKAVVFYGLSTVNGVTIPANQGVKIASANSIDFFLLDANHNIKIISGSYLIYWIPGQEPPTLIFTYSFPGDTNGLFYYLGATKYGSTFQNPVDRGEINVWANSYIDVRLPSKAFDRLNNGENPGGVGQVWHSNHSNTAWIVVQFTNNRKFRLTSFELWASSVHGLGDYMGENCLIQGSNDGSTWTTLLTFYPNVVSNTRWYSGSISNANFYNYYRIYSPQTIYHVIGDIEFYGELQL
jgi:hypothetical protein